MVPHPGTRITRPACSGAGGGSRGPARSSWQPERQSRVLRAGGVFAIYDVMRTGEGELSFPVHWAAGSQTSFVIWPEDYRRALDAAGFQVRKQRDRRAFAREFFRQVAARAAEDGAPPPLGVHLLMKNDVPLKITNVMRNLEQGLIAPVELVWQAR